MKISVREFVELIGLFGIISSLIFVGLQLMLDRQVALSAQFHARSILFQEQEQSVFENDAYISELAALWERNGKPSWWTPELDAYQRDNGYTTEFLVRETTQVRMRFIRLNDNYFQYANGLISDASWQSILIGVRTQLSNPFNRAVALSFNTLEPGFKDLMQNVIQEIDADR